MELIEGGVMAGRMNRPQLAVRGQALQCDIQSRRTWSHCNDFDLYPFSSAEVWDLSGGSAAKLFEAYFN